MNQNNSPCAALARLEGDFTARAPADQPGSEDASIYLKVLKLIGRFDRMGASMPAPLRRKGFDPELLLLNAVGVLALLADHQKA
ncbi:hypothetical protein AB4037_34340 [Labrys sp. KB_33_2]|uniref:hypothetical protein n=1 Tax=Labrys sp. KB_33_2 TaxID=3237479 RepID=UPI003F8F6B0C